MQADDCGPEASPAFWINRTSRLLTRHADARLKPFGLAMSHLPVLRALAEGTPRSQAELARIAAVEQPSMAETLARMERDGVVQREPHPSDKRTALVALTRRSRARFSKAMASLQEGERIALHGLTQKEKTVLRDLLQRVAMNIEAESE